MKKTVLNLFLATMLIFSVSACKNNAEKEDTTPQELAAKPESARTFYVVPEESTIRWRGAKPTGEHHGTIDVTSGEFHFKNATLESGEAVMDMTSVKVLDEGMDEDARQSLEKHLMGTAEGKEDDFFNTTKFPTAKFGITNVSKQENAVLIEGNLTLKEQTHSVKIPAKISWANDSSSVKIVSQKFVIDRTKWGVNYGSKSVFDNLGDKFINDEMELQIMVKAAVQK